MLQTKKLVRVTTNNQVAIPMAICRRLHLAKGSLLEADLRNNRVVFTPKRVVDEDYRTYARQIRRGQAQMRRGETASWEQVKAELASQRARRAKRMG
ncbi:MAG: AbrB/MazE/SpoVT family DNA-binding domain-containing protein [Candidatus Omnitrophica bacterium]|nr:AbrB/MazE/SpoVT family DNA-binding domain-containing protein [Candidatus Omnitrophota bacterium]